MRLQVVSVNHGTSAYADLMLRSLVAHHPDRSDVEILLLDNGSEGLERLAWAGSHGVEVRQSGYTLEKTVTTHGEILRDAVLATPDCDAYLFVDVDVCFVADDTIRAMAQELDSSLELFAVRAKWLGDDGAEWEPTPEVEPRTSRVRESLRRNEPGATWGEPLEFDIAIGDRVDPFCVLVRNDEVFRRTVEFVGLSPGMTECVRGGRWWDSFGLATQVMKTHGRTWRKSGQGVVHFGSVSWDSAWAAEKAARRDALLEVYPVPGPVGLTKPDS